MRNLSPKQVLINEAQAARKNLVASVDGGYRDWEYQLKQLKRYHEFLDAADKLAGNQRPAQQDLYNA